MTINFKKIVLLVYVLFSVTVSGIASAKKSSDAFNWEPVMNAIIQVESKGDNRAVSGVCCGPMQIKPVLVKQCNIILEARGSKKRFALSDRFSVQKSKEMFMLMQSEYNPTNNVEKAIRSWNGGNRYKVRSTNGYYRKVLAAMK